jgi:hypothetical protein
MPKSPRRLPITKPQQCAGGAGLSFGRGLGERPLDGGSPGQSHPFGTPARAPLRRVSRSRLRGQPVWGLSVSNSATVARCSRFLPRPRSPKAGPSPGRTPGIRDSRLQLSTRARRSRATGHELSDVGHGNDLSNRGSDLLLRQRLRHGSRLERSHESFRVKGRGIDRDPASPRCRSHRRHGACRRQRAGQVPDANSIPKLCKFSHRLLARTAHVRSGSGADH